MSGRKITAEEQRHALARLHELLAPGDTVYTVLKHTSSSGMYRVIACLIAREESILGISASVAEVLNWHWDDSGGVGVRGCGMDMGFHLVHSLSSVLFRDGSALKQSWV